MKQLEKVKSLKDQIYEIIKEDIINQTYQNNTVLNEKKISQELNVSKTPVREALKALEAEGWVEYVHRIRAFWLSRCRWQICRMCSACVKRLK